MKRVITIIVLAIGILQLQAQDQLSLSDAITIGLENNYDLRIQRNEQKVAEINNTWGNTGILPTVDFTVSANEDLNLFNQDNSVSSTVMPDLSLNWVFFDGFSARISKVKYEELQKQSEGNTAILVETTIQDIILAYNNCLLQAQMLDVYKQLADLSEDRYKRTEYSKDLGTGSTYETLQAKTSWLEDQSNYLQQKVDYDNAVRTLNFALAVEDQTKWEFTSDLSLNAPEYSLDLLSEKMKSNNKTLKNQYIAQTLMAKETALAKSDYMPSLSLSTGINTNMGTINNTTTGNVYSNTTDAYVGLTLSWNIFNGGTRKRSVAIAQIDEETSAVETEQMVHSLSNQLLQVYSNYSVQKAILTLANEQEETAELNLELSKEKLQNGNINSFNYRDVQIAYMDAAIARFTAIYNLLESNTELLRLTGGIIDEYDQSL